MSTASISCKEFEISQMKERVDKEKKKKKKKKKKEKKKKQKQN
jgi:hypothetical protein